MTNNDSAIQKFDEYNNTTSMVSMVRKELTIGDESILAFMDAEGLYYLNMMQLGKLIGKGGNAVITYYSFLLIQAGSAYSPNTTYDGARSALGKGFSCSLTPSFYVFSENVKYRVVSIKIARNFIRFWDKKSNKLAEELTDALFDESLQVRCEAAFVGVSPNVLDIHHATNEWLSSRQANKSVHGAFAQYCVEAKLPGRHIHDLMTTHVFGQTKRQAIACNKLVGENATVGLDYQDSVEGQLIMAKLKVKFMSYRKGSWRERVDRCFLESI